MPKTDMPKYTHNKSEISGLNNDDAFHNEDVLVELKKKNDYKMLPGQTLYYRTGRHIICIRGNIICIHYYILHEIKVLILFLSLIIIIILH